MEDLLMKCIQSSPMNSFVGKTEPSSRIEKKLKENVK